MGIEFILTLYILVAFILGALVSAIFGRK